MSFQQLSSRLVALQETTRQVETLISRLATLKFQPGSVPLDLDDEEDDITTELSSEIHQTLKEQAEDLELLEQEVEDLPEGRQASWEQMEKEQLGEGVNRAKAEVKAARSSFRKAQIAAKAALDLAQREERALLLSSLAAPPDLSSSTASLPRRRNQTSNPESKEDANVSAASSVTLALRRTHTLLASELSRSQFAHDTLKESTAALAQLGETYSSLDTLLSSSRNLLGTLLRSQKSDTWYLETAFWILGVTIGWLVFRRWVYGPAWWLVWLPLKMFYKAWMGVFVAVGLRGGRGSGVSVGTVGNEASMVEQPSMSGGAVRSSISASDVPGVRGTGSEPVLEQEGMIEEVGKIIDGSQREDIDANEPQAEPRNPKKRMWEEVKEELKEEQRRKDEL